MRLSVPVWRLLVLALPCGIVLAGSVDGALARKASASVAGHWHWSLKASCENSSKNNRACVEIFAMGLHIYAIRATKLTYRGSDSITVSDNGRFTERGSATFTALSPGAPKLKVCNPGVMESQLFQRTCRMTWKGTGHIEKGGTYLLDFYTDKGRNTYPNPKITYFEDYPAIGDTLIPAVPGTYNSQRYLSLVGYAGYLSGISIDLTVKHASH